MEGRRTVLVLPISPHEPGNGLAHRARLWSDVLAELGALTTLVVPVSGRGHDGDTVVPLTTLDLGGSALPPRAQRAPEQLGRTWALGSGLAPLAAGDLVLALRADLGPFALGLAAGTEAAVVVDLDDDDAALHRALGDADLAGRSARLVGELRRRADALTSVTGFDGTLAVPNSVPAGTEAVPRTGVSERIVMVGNFTYEPNRRGARWLVDEVLPRIGAIRPGVELALVGPGSEALAPHGVGFVPDLAPVYAAAAVAVVPLLHGSGSRVKALEAFAAGVPVVGTGVGLAGLPVTDGVDCLVADDPEGFAAAVLRVLDDPVLADGLADAARRGPAARLDRAVVVADAVAALRPLLERRPPPTLAWSGYVSVAAAEDGVDVMDDAGMAAHHLNPAAAAVFLLAGEDGTSPDALVPAVAEALGLDEATSRGLVDAALPELVGAGLLVAQRGRQRP